MEKRKVAINRILVFSIFMMVCTLSVFAVSSCSIADLPEEKIGEDHVMRYNGLMCVVDLNTSMGRVWQSDDGYPISDASETVLDDGQKYMEYVFAPNGDGSIQFSSSYINTAGEKTKENVSFAFKTKDNFFDKILPSWVRVS